MIKGACDAPVAAAISDNLPGGRLHVAASFHRHPDFLGVFLVSLKLKQKQAPADKFDHSSVYTTTKL